MAKIIQNFLEEYSRDKSVNDLSEKLKTAAKSMIEIGAILHLIKTNESPEFFDQVLKDEGINNRTAFRLLQVNDKLSFIPESAQQKLNKSQIFELLTLSESDMLELAKKNEINGVSIDNICSMSVRDLRENLKIAKKTSKLNEISLIEERQKKQDALEKLVKYETLKVCDKDLVALDIATSSFMLNTKIFQVQQEMTTLYNAIKSSMSSESAPVFDNVDEEKAKTIDTFLLTIIDSAEKFNIEFCRIKDSII